ncbi:MAG: OmpA family protein, partial [Marinobacter sp.]|nr:OmpA family protein [Marinobacter sp.]
HTDNVPIRTERFYSNWDLSAARAAAVANVLLARDYVQPTRLAVTGLADTEPRVSNTSPENRAKNRRVEIIIDLSEPMQEQEIRLRELIESESADQEAIIGIESASPSSGEISW